MANEPEPEPQPEVLGVEDEPPVHHLVTPERLQFLSLKLRCTMTCKPQRSKKLSSRDVDLIWVKVIKEGHHNDLFDGPGEPLPEGKQKEPKIKWRHSRARALLYDDIEKGLITFDEDGEPEMSLKYIYAMRPEYADYFFENFDRRLKALWEIYDSLISRAEDDIEALENYMVNHECSQLTWQGMIQWQGSEAQEHVRQDIEDELHLGIGYKAMYLKRPEYYFYFDYPTFKQKLRQEVRTKKYLHTLEVLNMQGMKAT